MNTDVSWRLCGTRRPTGYSVGMDLSTARMFARIAYIMNIEQGYAIDREIIYAAALLHDVGRADPDDTGRKHHELSVEYAGRILEQCGFSTQENEQICDAIGSHNTDGAEREGLAYVLYNADKLSRNCFDCKASDQCYWLESARNTGIKY